MIFFSSLISVDSTTGVNPLKDIDMNIVFDGDSLTYGQGAESQQYYPSIVRDWLQLRVKSLIWNSFGVNGQGTLEMMTDAATQIDSLVDPSKENIIVAWEDVNAILNDGRTAQQNFDDFTTYFTDRKNAGFDYCIILTGYYPRVQNAGYNKSSWNTGNPSPLDIQHDYFEMVLNAVTPVWDFHIDLREAPNIGGFTRGQSIGDGTYFVDSVHLQAEGYKIVAEQVQNEILKIYR